VKEATTGLSIITSKHGSFDPRPREGGDSS